MIMNQSTRIQRESHKRDAKVGRSTITPIAPVIMPNPAEIVASFAGAPAQIPRIRSRQLVIHHALVKC
jgi:hypothetical protein